MTFSPTRIAELRADLRELQSNPRLATFIREEITVVERALRELEQDGADDGRRLDEARAQFDHAVELARKRYGDAVQFDTHYFNRKR